MKKPETLTPERCRSFLPELRTNPEWQARDDAGLNEGGILGLRGCLDTVWPDAAPTPEEARYIITLREECSWRAMAYELLDGDESQINGEHLCQAAQRVVPAASPSSP